MRGYPWNFSSFLSNQEGDKESDGEESKARDAEVPDEKCHLGAGGQEYGAIASREGLEADTSSWWTTEATPAFLCLAIGYHGSRTIGSTSELHLVLSSWMHSQEFKSYM